MKHLLLFISAAAMLIGCGKAKATDADSVTSLDVANSQSAPAFDADSAYSYVAKQCEFGPRVPNSEAHRRAGDWMVEKLRQFGVQVTEQKGDLKGFDGTILHARNLFGQINPDAKERILLMAHYDSRPWADADPDSKNHKKPVMGANDGASGVGVILEILRQLQAQGSKIGVDILFSDAEDWGSEGDDESWAMGTRYFVEHPIKPGYRPSKVILLDMVGGKDASFPQEYFSVESDPALVASIWNEAERLGLSSMFPSQPGGAVTDDHVEFIKAGIPAIDIIDYRSGTGFYPYWHTVNDTMDNISKTTLRGVGQTVLAYLLSSSVGQ